MKVEFVESDVLGATLFVQGIEFLKGKDSEEEFQSLVNATAAFSNMFEVDYYISRQEYDLILNIPEKSGAVIFAIEENEYPYERCCEVYISNDNKLKKLI